MALLRSDKLSIDEIDLFKAVLRWGLSECKRRGLIDSFENRKMVLSEVLKLIRFPTMTMQEIATYVSPSNLLDSAQLLEIFTFLGQKGKKAPSKMTFPITPRMGSRDKWTFDPDLKWTTVTLSNGNATAANGSAVHSWTQGTVAWTKGKHCWRLFRDSNPTAWLLIGVARKMTHQQNSFQDANVWALCSGGTRYYAASTMSMTSNFNSGPIDCLFDADAGSLTILNLNTNTRHELLGLPTGGELAPHFGPHAVQSITVVPIGVKDFGNAKLVVKKPGGARTATTQPAAAVAPVAPVGFDDDLFAGGGLI